MPISRMHPLLPFVDVFHKPFADDHTWPPAQFPAGSSFWELGDGRIVWMDADRQCRAAAGSCIMPAFVLDGPATPSSEGAFRAAIALEEMKPKPPASIADRLTREELRRGRYSLPPLVTSRHDGGTPYSLTQRTNLRLYPVLDAGGQSIAEVWFAWKEGSWRVGRTQFINIFEERLTPDECGRLTVAAEDQDWATLDAFHPEMLPWFCSKCGCNYAQRAWQTSPQFDDDGWPDSYRGVCPQGHERMIAD